MGVYKLNPPPAIRPGVRSKFTSADLHAFNTLPGVLPCKTFITYTQGSMINAISYLQDFGIIIKDDGPTPKAFNTHLNHTYTTKRTK